MAVDIAIQPFIRTLKAIFAAWGWRTLQTIGWEHAEPGAPVHFRLWHADLDQGTAGDSRSRSHKVTWSRSTKIPLGLANPAATIRPPRPPCCGMIRQATPGGGIGRSRQDAPARGISPGTLWNAAITINAALDAQPEHPRSSRFNHRPLPPLFSTRPGDDPTRRLKQLLRQSAGVADVRGEPS